MFQSTRPHGARRCSEACDRTACFNPRARTGRDAVVVLITGTVFQSTRPRGARRFPVFTGYAPVFQSTRRAGATAMRASAEGFNPRARAGRDGSMRRPLMPGDVSIHAPARGATLNNAQDLARNLGFNPRARAGRDAFIVTDYK